MYRSKRAYRDRPLTHSVYSRSYLPLMNIAMEYMEQNNLPLAYDYFEKSLQKNTTDPFLHNEVAVYYYKKEM